MAESNQDGQFVITDLPIIGDYSRQRFRQWSSEDSANWYIVKEEKGKRPRAMYPVLTRQHVSVNFVNYLQFSAEPREIFKTVNYAYVVVGNLIYMIDNHYNQVNITASTPLATFNGPIYFTYLVVNQIVFACFTDQQYVYIYREDTGVFSIVTDANCPGGTGSGVSPGFIATFGNRIVVSVLDSSQFFLSQINLGGSGFDQTICFTIAGSSVFAFSSGFIRQIGVLNNTLYMFNDFVTDVWSNRASVFSGTNTYFPWTINSTYNFNFGIANPTSLDINFGYMAFLGQNSDGLLQFMVTKGDVPQVISSKAIDVLLQRYTNVYGANNPFLSANSNGFLYQYEDTIFYRMSGGPFDNSQMIDQGFNDSSIEFCFDDNTWHRCIENNGERNRVQYHVFFNFLHLVTVIGENTVYMMSGRHYYNEIRNPNQADGQASNAYLSYPMRYERVTPIISQKDYSEFETEYVEIDFEFGISSINYSANPYANAVFIIDETLVSGKPQYIISENPGPDGQPVFLLEEGSNVPQLGDLTYNYLFNPHIELYYSDDGGVSFNSADVREFAQEGVYQWRMRWYQLGTSRNRVYKLVCVSIVPIVVLGGVMNVRRTSGGAN